MDGNRNETEKQPDGCGNEGICKQDGRGEASIGVRKPSGMIACPQMWTYVDTCRMRLLMMRGGPDCNGLFFMDADYGEEHGIPAYPAEAQIRCRPE